LGLDLDISARDAANKTHTGRRGLSPGSQKEKIITEKQNCLGASGPGSIAPMRVRNILGFVDGKTTNPRFVAKNPDVQPMIASGHKLSRNEQKEEYKKKNIKRSCGLFHLW